MSRGMKLFKKKNLRVWVWHHFLSIYFYFYKHTTKQMNPRILEMEFTKSDLELQFYSSSLVTSGTAPTYI